MERTCPFGLEALTLRLPGMSDAELLVLGDAARATGRRSERVTALIAAAYDGPDGFRAEALSLVDRVAALFGVALGLGRWPARFVAACGSCGAGNSLTVASEEYSYAPATNYEVTVGATRLMQPNGTHEALLETGGLLALDTLILDGPRDNLNEDAAMKALAEAAPRWTADLPYTCAHCGAECRFWFDPLDWIADHLGGLLREVHEFARAYGWTEPQVLALPRARRRAYIALIEGQEAGA